MRKNHGIQIEEDLLNRARDQAKTNHRSLNGQLVHYIEEGLRRDEQIDLMARQVIAGAP